MKKIRPDSIAPETRAWFGNQIQNLALRHDLAGPAITRVRRGKYMKELVKQFRARALAAINARELVITTEEADIFCREAAKELIDIRQTRADHESGKLPTELMRQLPAYAAFPHYLNEAPSLVLGQLMEVVRDLEKAEAESFGAEPLSQPRHPTHPLSQETRAWIELQALGLACADDAYGAPFGSVPREDYITESALRIREKARRAIRIGDLNVPTEDIDNICWVAACEAYLLRSLQAGLQAGEISDQDIKKMPIYGPYKDYFEKGSSLAAMATRIAAAAGQPIRPSGEQN
jgi:hypothetical protein